MTKKRKARRTTERLKKEYSKRNLGESMYDTIRRLRTRVSYRDKVIEGLRNKVKELEEEKRKEVSEVSKLKNREIRKRDTIIKNLKKRKKKGGRGKGVSLNAQSYTRIDGGSLNLPPLF